MIKDTTIKIAVKIKPSPPGLQQPFIKSEQVEGNPPTVIMNAGADGKKFQVDAIHDANTSKKTMFTDLFIDRFVDKFTNGFNVAVMAYGNTGAGKTFCMEGNTQHPGIILDSIRAIYEKIKPEAMVSCSYIQLYNQKIYDLLGEDPNNQHLKLRYEAQRDFIVEDLTWHRAGNAKEMEKLWRKGNKNRTVASNKVHDMSSRSHALFVVAIIDQTEEKVERYRQMTFVDLAGSERLFDHVGRLSKQSIEINKSLFVLRKVIKILEESTVTGKQIYVPYRDSKLTSLLKLALGGNCLTMMIACIDSTYQYRQQTLLTLNYAISAGRISNTAKVNIEPMALQNRQLKIENQRMKKQLQGAMHQIELMQRRQKGDADKKSQMQYSHKIIQCISTIRELIKSNKQLREQLDEQRKTKRQQQIQIEMLMQQRYMVKRMNSMHNKNISEVLPTLGNSPLLHKHSAKISELPKPLLEKEQISPKLIRIREIMSNSSSPVKNRGVGNDGREAKGGAMRETRGELRGEEDRKTEHSVRKRNKYVVYRSEPDDPASGYSERVGYRQR